ncbi:MAG: universal stress protein [Pseudomonadota bacterium]
MDNDLPLDKKRTFLCVIDGSPEVKQAIYYTSRRAKKTGAAIMLLGIVPKVTGGSEMMWGDVKNQLEKQNNSDTQKSCDFYRDYISEHTHIDVKYILKQGRATDVIKETLKEHPEIRILVLGTGLGENPGPIIKELTSGTTKLNIPITLVPGDMSEDEIDLLS